MALLCHLDSKQIRPILQLPGPTQGGNMLEINTNI